MEHISEEKLSFSGVAISRDKKASAGSDPTTLFCKKRSQ